MKTWKEGSPISNPTGDLIHSIDYWILNIEYTEYARDSVLIPRVHKPTSPIQGSPRAVLPMAHLDVT